MNWPKNKSDRETLEITGFIEAYARLPEGRRFEVVSKSEAPDYIVIDKQSGQEYGVELTSVYLNNRSVPDIHMKGDSGCIPYDKAAIEKYMNRLIDAIKKKVVKARKGYDLNQPLILAIYMNEYISIYLDEKKLNAFVNSYESVFDNIAPFTEVVFWNLSNDGVFRVLPG